MLQICPYNVFRNEAKDDIVLGVLEDVDIIVSRVRSICKPDTSFPFWSKKQPPKKQTFSNKPTVDGSELRRSPPGM